MYKKLLITLGILTSIIFSFTICLANDAGTMVKDAANGVRNVVGGAENTVENAAKDISNTSKNATENMEKGANTTVKDNYTNQETTTTNNARRNNYNATRTATDTKANTFMGMNATAWTWLIIGIAAIAIVALVWYYATQVRSSNYDDKD